MRILFILILYLHVFHSNYSLGILIKDDCGIGTSGTEVPQILAQFIYDIEIEIDFIKNKMDLL